jgi:hypothetical protein
MNVGDRARIERDETRYRSKGTWPQFRGRTGTVVQTSLGEYGVVFGKATPRTDGRGAFQFEGTVTWFQPHELRPCGKAPESNSEPLLATPEVCVSRPNGNDPHLSPCVSAQDGGRPLPNQRILYVP